MKILEIRKVEDCFDGSSVFNYRFDCPWSRDSIKRLDALGTLELFADFPRPFFRVHAANGLQIKGVEGEDDCRVIFPSHNKEVIRQTFEDQFP